MTQWSCYCTGESVCYWLEKGNSMDTWRRRTYNTWWWRTTLIKSERCYWMTASLYKEYNTFSDRESEKQHRTTTFAELPNHPLLLITFKQRVKYYSNHSACFSLEKTNLVGIHPNTEPSTGAINDHRVKWLYLNSRTEDKLSRNFTLYWGNSNICNLVRLLPGLIIVVLKNTSTHSCAACRSWDVSPWKISSGVRVKT